MFSFFSVVLHNHVKEGGHLGNMLFWLLSVGKNAGNILYAGNIWGDAGYAKRLEQQLKRASKCSWPGAAIMGSQRQSTCCWRW